jgi:hypothetical protein
VDNVVETASEALGVVPINGQSANDLAILRVQDRMTALWAEISTMEARQLPEANCRLFFPIMQSVATLYGFVGALLGGKDLRELDRQSLHLKISAKRADLLAERIKLT